ncbi:MAG: hypothetical protein JNN30_05110 [Rhodanobacteraceae bacterium]|nr:hypothetical protein [Rhodanobacteraceae bacterium]
MALNFCDPSDLYAPLGFHAHGAVVPAGAELLYVSGQLGIGADGNCPGHIWFVRDERHDRQKLTETSVRD